jgi:hypothetical protein
MDDWILPDELQRLETDLGRRRLPEASPGLPQRILGGLQHRRRIAESQARWQFGLALRPAAPSSCGIRGVDRDDRPADRAIGARFAARGSPKAGDFDVCGGKHDVYTQPSSFCPT